MNVWSLEGSRKTSLLKFDFQILDNEISILVKGAD